MVSARVGATKWTCTNTRLCAAPTSTHGAACGNAPLLKHIPRALLFLVARAVRTAFVDMQTMTRFPVPADSVLPSRIPAAREERAD